MDDLIVSDPKRRSGLTPIREEIKQDLQVIDQALVDQTRRRLAEVALSLTTQVLQDAESRGDPPLTPAEQEALALAGINDPWAFTVRSSLPPSP